MNQRNAETPIHSSQHGQRPARRDDRASHRTTSDEIPIVVPNERHSSLEPGPRHEVVKKHVADSPRFRIQDHPEPPCPTPVPITRNPLRSRFTCTGIGTGTKRRQSRSQKFHLSFCFSLSQRDGGGGEAWWRTVERNEERVLERNRNRNRKKKKKETEKFSPPQQPGLAASAGAPTVNTRRWLIAH